ncbi:hypothetical protein FD754_014064 [Muntiacus muntjak]|uniref:Uncharacterized protein n=1 Tax=Muntiacus muntjak TaxID=9888 RepID=A0A5N3VIS6_MUNMU|nr:hypothetical protein FD754_014064 [Muntiacus muntjak]
MCKATHVYTFCSLFVPCSSAKCKMSLKTGIHITQGWVFSGDKHALGVQNCNTPAGLISSDGVSLSWTPPAVGTNGEQKAYTGPWNRVQDMKLGSN